MHLISGRPEGRKLHENQGDVTQFQLPTNRKHLMTACSFSSAAPVTKKSALLYFLPAHVLNFDFKDLDCFSGVRNFLIDKLLARIVFHGKLL